MKKIDSNGIGAVEGLLILVIVGLVCGTGYYVFSKNNEDTNSKSAAQQASVTEDSSRKDAVPEGWKEYTNDEYGFSFNLPGTWKVNESKLNPNDSATKQLLSVSFAPSDSTHDFMTVEVLDMKFDEMLKNEWFNDKNIFESQSPDRKEVTLNGHKGHQYMSYGDPDTFYTFYEVSGRLIIFNDSFGGDYNEKESQQIFESFTIN